MAEKLEALVGKEILSKEGATIQVASLCGDDKVIGQCTRWRHHLADDTNI